MKHWSLPGKTVRRTLLVGFLGTALAVSASAMVIHHASRGRLYTDLQTVPPCRVAVVLGCARTLRDGRTNLYFQNRVRAAAELYAAGKVEFLIASGDNHRAGYDEPSDLKAALIARGVPADRIYCDYAGFRTLDSVVRARAIFGQRQVTIVSQAFHNERALFIARHRGVDAIGFNAGDVSRYHSLRARCREQFARVKTVLDVFLLQTRPKFYGPPVTIGVETPQTGANRG